MTDAQQLIYQTLPDTILTTEITRPLLVTVSGKDAGTYIKNSSHNLQ